MKRLTREVLESIERIRLPKRKPVYPWLDNPRLFSSHVQAICERAGIPFGSFGDLRKGSASEVYREQGYDAAQKHLQHAPGSSATSHYLAPDHVEVPAPRPLRRKR